MNPRPWFPYTTDILTPFRESINADNTGADSGSVQPRCRRVADPADIQHVTDDSPTAPASAPDPAPEGGSIGRRAILGVLILAAALRIALLLAVQPWGADVRNEVLLQADMVGYHALAVNLLREGRFELDMAGRGEILRTPAYPGFLAGVYAVVGERPWAALLIQAGIDTLTCLLLMLIAGRYLGRGAAVAAGLFYAVDPFAVLFSTTLLSETLFVFLLVAGLAVFCGSAGARRIAPAAGLGAAAGAVWGLAALTRPILGYATVPMAIVLLVAHLARRRPGAALAAAGALAAGMFLTLLPWLARNHARYGRFSLSTSSGYNLLVLHVGPMEMERRGEGFFQIRDALLAEARRRMIADGRDPETLNEFAKADYWRDLAIDYIRRDPGLYAKRWAMGIAHAMGNLGTHWYAHQLRLPSGEIDLNAYANPFDAVADWFRRKTAWEIVFGLSVAALLLVTYGAAAIGLFVAWSRRSAVPAASCVVLGAYLLALTGPAGVARFKLPVVPVYLLFAGAGAAWLWALCRRNRSAPCDGRGAEQT